jgi:hypothetical protein
MKLRYIYYLQGNQKYLVLGILFGVVAILVNRMPYWIYEPFENQKDWIRTEAQIERFVYMEENKMYEHWVSFKTPTGENVQTKSTISSSTLPILHDTYYIMYNPANPQEFFNNDLDKNQGIVKITRFMTFVFGSISFFVLTMLTLKLYYQSYKPAYIPLFDFWIEIIGGSMGALAFAIPAMFIDVLLWYFTGSWSQSDSPVFILWIFRILGVVVLIAVIWMVKHFYIQRPRVTKS